MSGNKELWNQESHNEEINYLQLDFSIELHILP